MHTPRVVMSSTKWATVACGRMHTVAITLGGHLYAWGGNAHGQLGLGDVSPRAAPTQVRGRERERATCRERERERKRGRDRVTCRERERERATCRERERERERKREREREKERERERE